MSLVNRVRTGRREVPLKLCIYGAAGCGKTTLASQAPDALVYCSEAGAEQLDVARLDAAETWPGVLEDMRTLEGVDHPYKTIVIDTLDALEPTVVQHICKAAGKESLGDLGYGKGFVELANQWRLFLGALERLQAVRGMHVITIAHCHVKPFNDPTHGQYDRYVPKLQEKIWNLTSEWSDIVGYAAFELAPIAKDGQRTRAITTGARVLHTVKGSGFEAKNRYGITEPMPLSWGVLWSKIQAHGETAGDILAKIDLLASSFGDAEIVAKASQFVEQAAGDVQKLREIENALREKANQQEVRA